MQIEFQILRQTRETAPTIERFLIEADPSETILSCLNRIKWEQDGSLAFRKNCRNTICGSCSMRINGRSTLACKENIAGEMARMGLAADEIPTMTIAPLGNLPVIKDLVVDMQPFWDDLEKVEPYVSTASRQLPEREFLQSPDDRAKFDATGNCILCGACYSECNAKEVNPEFVGPHALAKAQRLIADDRDDRRDARLEQFNNTESGVWSCTRCFFCNSVCPMEVAPLDRISQIKGEILDRSTKDDSRPIRHRKVLLELVEQGGWVDERKFSVQVIGNYFKDLKGLLSLAPVGLRVVARGKFPTHFDPSEGTAEVRSLIAAVKAETQTTAKAETKATTSQP